jgi:sugar O-acyltransferase (sialic acid O-acetyltransferase NeuD family)
MLIVGAKGFAKEVLEVMHENNHLQNLVFYDDVNLDAPDLLFDTFRVLKSPQEASHYFKTVDNRFTIGIGNPVLRKKMYNTCTALGGELSTIVSPRATVGSYDVVLGTGSFVLPHAILSNSVSIGMGCIVYYSSIITHDCVIGDFVEISPNAILLGRSSVGSYSRIGANATVLPDVKIGQNVIVGAGAIVTKDVPDDCVVMGNPARISKQLTPLQFNK